MTNPEHEQQMDLLSMELAVTTEALRLAVARLAANGHTNFPPRSAAAMENDLMAIATDRVQKLTVTAPPAPPPRPPAILPPAIPTTYGATGWTP